MPGLCKFALCNHYEIIVNGDTLAFIFEPLACHSYNILKTSKGNIKIASIDTMHIFGTPEELSAYLNRRKDGV